MGLFKRSLIVKSLMLTCCGILFAAVGIEVTPDGWDIGKKGRGDWTKTDITVRNSGDEPARVKISATNTQNWTLGAEPGPSIFAIQYGIGSVWTSVSTSVSDMIPSLAIGVSQPFSLHFYSPLTADPAITAVQNSNLTLSVVSLPVDAVWQWTRQMGPGTADVSYGVAIDGAENIYIAGNTSGGLDGNISAGREDIFLIKYNSSGEKQWTRQLGTSADENTFGVAVDGLGNIYVAGTTAGGIDGNTNAGGSDIFLVKYNSAGEKQWTRQMGSSEFDSSSGVAVDGSGNIYVAGWTMGGIDGNTSAGGYDILLVKYNASGEKQWTRQLGTSADDGSNGVAVDGSGNIYVAGWTMGGIDGNTSAGDADIVIAKYDSSGAKQWTRQMGTGAEDYGNGICFDGLGGVYITGYTYGGLDGNISAGGQDIYLAKYNLAGEKQWTSQTGTSADDNAIKVAADGSGDVYVAGLTSGGLDGNTNAGNDDILLIKYNSAGIKQWTRQKGTSASDSAYGVALANSGNIYVTGYTTGGLDDNTNYGDSDAFLMKYR